MRQAGVGGGEGTKAGQEPAFGADLSNLAWAVARSLQSSASMLDIDSPPMMLTEWITEEVLRQSGDFLANMEEAADFAKQAKDTLGNVPAVKQVTTSAESVVQAHR